MAVAIVVVGEVEIAVKMHVAATRDGEIKVVRRQGRALGAGRGRRLELVGEDAVEIVLELLQEVIVSQNGRIRRRGPKVQG